MFAPNVFRVCVDTYQGLKDQSSANEAVNLLITEFGEIFNETMGETGNSREDLSSVISCDSECPFTCSLNIEMSNSELQQSQSNYENSLNNLEPNKDCISPSISLNGKVCEEFCKTNDEAKIKLDRKRKEYQNKNHRTIDEFDDERCQSFDGGLSVASVQKQPPQRCNSDGNSEELCSSTGPITLSAVEDNGLRKQHTNCQTHEIIITTNSSDSVSTDDNTTTTATSTGATVCSVVIGGQLGPGHPNERYPSSSDDNPDKSSSLNSSDPKLLYCEYAIGESNLKTGRSGSCGSDCTENMNIPASLSFTSDDEEDSLSKSIASDCSGDSSPSSSSSCSSHMSGNEAGSSSSLNENGNDTQMMDSCESKGNNQKTVQNIHLLENKPWQVSKDQADWEHDLPQLSRAHLMFESEQSNSTVFDFMNGSPSNSEASLSVDTQISMTLCEEAPVSPSAFRSYLSNQLDETVPPSPPVTIDAAIYADRHRNEAKFDQAFSDITGSKTNTEQPLLTCKPITKTPGSKARNKRFQSIRRKLQQFDIDFEQENGYQPTHEHKMASSFARPLMIELSSLLNVRTGNLKNFDYYDAENEAMEEDISFCKLESLSAKARSNANWKFASDMAPAAPLSTEDIFNTIFGNPREKSLTKISEMMDEIQRALIEKRIISNRPDSLDAMSSEQIFDEKLALQKALLRFEALHGRPDSKAERDIVRPVYDR